MPRSPWPVLLAFGALILIVYAVKGYRGGKGLSGDALVLAHLGRAGSDLSKPHPVEFFVHAPSEEAARIVADQIRSSGFDAKVDRAAQGSGWLCLASKSMVPELSTLEGIRSRFGAIAREVGGEYDGWGKPVVK